MYRPPIIITTNIQNLKIPSYLFYSNINKISKVFNYVLLILVLNCN